MTISEKNAFASFIYAASQAHKFYVEHSDDSVRHGLAARLAGARLQAARDIGKGLGISPSDLKSMEIMRRKF